MNEAQRITAEGSGNKTLSTQQRELGNSNFYQQHGADARFTDIWSSPSISKHTQLLPRRRKLLLSHPDASPRQIDKKKTPCNKHPC